MITFRVAAAILALLVAGLVAACGGAEPKPEAGGARTISGNGLSITLPDDWTGRAFENDTGLRVILSANEPLAPGEDDEGSRTRERLDRDGIVLAIAYWPDRPPTGQGDALESATLPLVIHRSDLGGFEGLTEASAVRSLTVDGHLVQVMAHFGITSPSDQLLDEANAVLSTFAIGR